MWYWSARVVTGEGMATVSLAQEDISQGIGTGARLGRAIGASHLAWTFDQRSTEAISGTVTSRAIGPLRASALQLGIKCQYWAGQRTSQQIRLNPEPYVIVVMPLDGAITLTSDSTTVLVSEGELVLWDSSRPLSFRIEGDRFRQISVLVPQRNIRADAETCAALHCMRVDKNNILSELCTQHIATLAEFRSSPLYRRDSLIAFRKSPSVAWATASFLPELLILASIRSATISANRLSRSTSSLLIPTKTVSAFSRRPSAM